MSNGYTGHDRRKGDADIALIRDELAAIHASLNGNGNKGIKEKMGIQETKMEIVESNIKSIKDYLVEARKEAIRNRRWNMGQILATVTTLLLIWVTYQHK